MSKILVVPDIHGRDFWKKPCQKWQESIVFLGDYHDPYDLSIYQPSKKESLDNLKELVDFVTKRRKDIKEYPTVCLCGNHDWSYYTGHYRCRYDYGHSKEVLELLNKLELQFMFILNSGKSFLFSHAGITKSWLNFHNIESPKKFEKEHIKFVEDVPYSRGGDSPYGSFLWNSLSDYKKDEHLSEYYQVFGHTWMDEPVITDTYAMLDCCKCFVINNDNIKPYE
jgi:hypothetical protein